VTTTFSDGFDASHGASALASASADSLASTSLHMVNRQPHRVNRQPYPQEKSTLLVHQAHATTLAHEKTFSSRVDLGWLEATGIPGRL